MKHPPEVKLVVQADSREPDLAAGDHPDALFRPWRIRARERVDIPTERVHLREGDYAAPGMALWRPIGDEGPWRGEPLCVIERKALGDAISTVVGSTTDALGQRAENRDRFEEELCRLRAYAWRAIVIEGSPADVQLEAQRPERRFNAASVLGSYAVFAARFGVQVWWAGSRAGAEWYVGTMLARVWSEFTGGAEYRKAAARGELGFLPWARGHRETLDAEEYAVCGGER